MESDKNLQKVVEPLSFVPNLTHADEVGVVALLRQLPGCQQIAVWSRECATVEASLIHDWMQSQIAQWPIWGRIAMRLGGDVLDPMLLDGARCAEDRRIETERAAQIEADEHRRKAAEITLFLYDSKEKRPALGLERGCDDVPFWKMKFEEKWERDRVVDWLRWQKTEFADFEAYFREFGSLELERHVLAGMRAGETAARARGLTSTGRRPLRFWRGEK